MRTMSILYYRETLSLKKRGKRKKEKSDWLLLNVSYVSASRLSLSVHYLTYPHSVPLLHSNVRRLVNLQPNSSACPLFITAHAVEQGGWAGQWRTLGLDAWMTLYSPIQ